MAEGLVGCKVFTLSRPRGLPRGTDLVEDIVVSRVIKVEPTPSAPRGCITLIAREGGFRNINVDDITEVVGNFGAIKPRETQREVKQEAREGRREKRRSKRVARRRLG